MAFYLFYLARLVGKQKQFFAYRLTSFLVARTNWQLIEEIWPNLAQKFQENIPVIYNNSFFVFRKMILISASLTETGSMYLVFTRTLLQSQKLKAV